MDGGKEMNGRGSCDNESEGHCVRIGRVDVSDVAGTVPPSLES